MGMDSRQADLLAEVSPKQLGRRMRSARLATGVTQAELADGGGVSVGYVSRIESGQRRPNLPVLARLAGRLETSVEQLLTGVAAGELDRIRLALDYAELSLESGEAEEARSRAAEARGLADTAGLADSADRARYLHARALEGLGDLDDAILELEPLLPRLAGVLRAEAGIALCRCYRESGDLAQSVETGERNLEHLAEIGLEDGDEAVRTAVTLAAAYFERGDVSHAVRVCRTAVRQAEKLDSPRARASAYWNASMMEARQGTYRGALPLAERALALLGEGQDGRNLARLRTDLGELQLSLDPPRVKDAQENLRRAAEDLAWSSAGVVDVARNDLALARSLLLDGDLSGAMELGRQVHGAVSDQAPLLAADAKTLEGQVCAAHGNPAMAADAYRQAVHILTGVGADRSAGQLWFDLAGLLEDVGDPETALQAYRSAAAASGLRSTSARIRCHVPARQVSNTSQ